LGQTIDY